MSIVEEIDLAILKFPDKVAVVFEGASITYRQLLDIVNRLANLLLRIGVKKHDRIALLLPNVPAFIFSYLAAAKVGATIVSLNVMLKKEELRYALNDSEASLLITVPALNKLSYKKHSPDLRGVLVVEDELYLRKLYLNTPENALDVYVENEEIDVISVEEEDPLAILYSSGTTGQPKGVVLSHKNVLSNVMSTISCCHMAPNDRLLLCLPLFHCFGQNFIMNSGLVSGATLILQRRYQLDTTVDLVANNSITKFFAVPTMFIQFLKAKVALEKLNSVKFFFSAGAPLPLNISQDWFKSYSIQISQGYGLTESSPFACFNPGNRSDKMASIGHPIPGVKMKVMKDSVEVAPGKWGELLIQGPNVMSGYLGRPIETQEVIEDGWLHTGDIGYRDQDGFFYICDRLKDMVIVSGFNVYPTEIENVILRLKEVREVAAYGVPDPIKGERLKVSIVLESASLLTETNILSYCGEVLANYKVPSIVEIHSSLPKSASGKVLKNLLRQGGAVELK